MYLNIYVKYMPEISIPTETSTSLVSSQFDCCLELGETHDDLLQPISTHLDRSVVNRCIRRARQLTTNRPTTCDESSSERMTHQVTKVTSV